MSQKLDWIQRR